MLTENQDGVKFLTMRRHPRWFLHGAACFWHGVSVVVLVGMAAGSDIVNY